MTVPSGGGRFIGLGNKSMSLRDKGVTPDIAKLLEKLQKDPSSKLFVPLAEEYVKNGFLDDAMTVLKEGLQVHPTYLTARVSLGKVYLLKGLIAEAKSEFEGVIKLNPENLVAHRKLAKIYKDEGNFPASRASCEIVLSQSPADKEMKALLDEVDKKLREVPAVVEPPASPSLTAHSAVSDIDFSGPEEDDFSMMPSGPIDLPVSLERDPSPQNVLPEKPSSQPPFVEEKPGPERSSADSVVLEHPPESSQPAPTPMEAATPISDHTGSPPFNEKEDSEQTVVQGRGEAITSITLADLYVSQGHFDKGIEIYRRILEMYPEDGKIREKLSAAEQRHADRPSGSSTPSRGVREETPGTKRGDPKREEKIKRLQAWLENIKKGERR
jgi:tetratricopeptide (TPR) repeat protein